MLVIKIQELYTQILALGPKKKNILIPVYPKVNFIDHLPSVKDTPNELTLQDRQVTIFSV